MSRSVWTHSWILMCLLLNSCTFAVPEPRIYQAKPETHKFMGLPTVPNCWSLYNDNMHKAWAECMGVGYK